MSQVAPVTVVVPCCNDEAKVPALVERLAALEGDGGRGWEVLFVDDGSVDSTFGSLLRCLRHRPWAKVLRHPAPLGVGAVLRTALRYVEAPVVCTIDSRCTYPPERLPDLVALLEEGGEIATASAGMAQTGRPTGANGFSPGFGRMVGDAYQACFGQDREAVTCPLRAYRRQALEHIRFRSNGVAALPEILLRATLAGYRVRALPVEASRPLGARSLLSHARILALGVALRAAHGVRLLMGRQAR